jgi:hypothetical protein
VSRQIAELQARASRRDQTNDAAQRWIDSENSSDANDEASAGQEQANLSASATSEPEPKPRQMCRRYLNRNGTWLRATRISKKKIGEPVFIRRGFNDFVQIGVVNKRGHLPACYIEEEKETAK